MANQQLYDLLLRGMSEEFPVVSVRTEEDMWRVYFNDIIVREINPLTTRRMKCYFEQDAIVEFTMEELEILLSEMYEKQHEEEMDVYRK